MGVEVARAVTRRKREQHSTQHLTCRKWLLPSGEEEGVWRRRGWVLLEELGFCVLLSKKREDKFSGVLLAFGGKKKSRRTWFSGAQITIYQVVQV